MHEYSGFKCKDEDVVRKKENRKHKDVRKPILV
jgi:hypothetical protein